MPPNCMGMLSQTPASMLELQLSAPCTAKARMLTLLAQSATMADELLPTYLDLYAVPSKCTSTGMSYAYVIWPGMYVARVLPL